MKRLHSSAAALAATVILIGPVHSQERPTQAPAQDRAPAAQNAMAESDQRRQEASVDLEEVLAKVSASTGKEFLVDPRVRARVYGVPQFDNPTYADLLSILRLHGYMAVEIEGRVNVMPDANARNMPVRLLQRDDDSVPDDEWVTRVIAVPNAAQLVPILRPLMPQAAHLAATVGGESPQDDKLVLVDTYANVRRMTEVINALTR